MEASELLAFEQEMAEEFEAGHIKAPLHLAGGNEEQLIRIFDDRIRPSDWVLTTWRAHYHALLKGVPRGKVKDAILRGRSISLCFPEYRVLSSGIVGGICPIAVGLGWAIKRNDGDEYVYCFVGDMAAETGIYHECSKYAAGHRLPVEFIIEDNGVSVLTDTREVWGETWNLAEASYYPYVLTRPHVGTGKFVRF